MTAQDSTPGDRENVSEEQANDRWEYSVQGRASATGEWFEGRFDRGEAEVIVYAVTADGEVPVSVIRGGSSGLTPGMEILVELSPAQARRLGQDLIEQAVDAESCER
jgi:hypothetical protein